MRPPRIPPQLPPRVERGTGTTTTTTVAFPAPSVDVANVHRLTARDVVERAFRTAPVGDPRLDVSAVTKRKRELALGVLFAAMALDADRPSDPNSGNSTPQDPTLVS